MATFTETGNGGALLQGSFSRHYTYEATGGVTVYRCAAVSIKEFFITQYGPGDIAFSVFAARKGILEKVCIKSVGLNCIPRNCASIGAGCFPIYRDKYNTVWTDNELLTQQESIDIAQAYIDKIKGYEESLLRNC